MAARPKAAHNSLTSRPQDPVTHMGLKHRARIASVSTVDETKGRVWCFLLR